MKKKSVLIVYEYFFPGYKAGGPIQSLVNLVVSLKNEFDFFVVTGAYDLGVKDPYSNVILNQWNKVLLPGCHEKINVFYGDHSFGKKEYTAITRDLKPDFIYINGIFSLKYFLWPILMNNGKSSQLVICPRGMLQQGALAIKPLKKKIYLFFLKLSGLLKNADWHATNDEEKNDIIRHFYANRKITVASNIPKVPIVSISRLSKEAGRLKLVFISLITKKKNLSQLIEAVNLSHHNVSLDIYGPVKDSEYWKRCELLIKNSKGRVLYKNDLIPIEVQNTLANYHAFILFTKGENFGHAIYESLSVGRPAITSHFTPWINLESKKAGKNVDINNMDECLSAIEKFRLMNQEDFNNYCIGAHNLALDYFAGLDAINKYKQLFK